MVDFTGQKRIFVISAVALLISVPISILVAFYKDNYLYSIYCEVALTGILMVLFGPNWPYLNLNKPEWRPDTDNKPVVKPLEEKGSHLKSKSYRRK